MVNKSFCTSRRKNKICKRVNIKYPIFQGKFKTKGLWGWFGLFKLMLIKQSFRGTTSPKIFVRYPNVAFPPICVLLFSYLTLLL